MTGDSPLRVAVLTPPGAGAVAVVGLRGPGALAVLRAAVRRGSGPALPPQLGPGRAYFGRVELAPGTWEEVVAVPGPAGPPGAGESAEVHCHGGVAATRAVVAALQRLGAAPVAAWDFAARPGGFDARFLRPLCEAPTARVAAVWLDQYRGAFRRAEADPARAARLAELAKLAGRLNGGFRVGVAGAPNAGKSSLVNALSGYERSVVADLPGTTRDVVVTRLALDGWPFDIADLAGFRAVGGELERAGMARARAWLAGADLVVWLRDASDPAPAEPESAGLPAGVPVLRVANKLDAAPGFAPASGELGLSARTGAGVPALITAVVAACVPAPPRPGRGGAAAGVVRVARVENWRRRRAGAVVSWCGLGGAADT